MRLADQISRNEQILWSGRKSTKVSVLEAIFNPMLFFALIWGAIDLTFMSFALNSGKEDANPGIVGFIVPFFLLHLMPVWLYVFGVIASAIRAKHTEYCITDKGIYIQSGVFTTTVEVKPFTDLSHVTVRQGIFDKICHTGDVITECGHLSTTSYSSYRNNRAHHHGMNIENIEQYEEIFQLVKEYQDAIYSDTMYPNDLRPAENHGYNTKYIGNNRF